MLASMWGRYNEHKISTLLLKLIQVAGNLDTPL